LINGFTKEMVTVSLVLKFCRDTVLGRRVCELNGVSGKTAAVVALKYGPLYLSIFTPIPQFFRNILANEETVFRAHYSGFITHDLVLVLCERVLI
jgi:hypothetical protein